MGQFQKENKFGKGGARKGTEPKTKIEKLIQEAAQDIARKFIEDNIIPVLQTYFQLAKGRKVKHRSATTGRILWTEYEADAARTRHFVERLVPAARQGIDIAMGTPEEFYRAIQDARRDHENKKQ